MWNLQLITLTLTLVPSLVSAGLFAPDSQVKMLDAKSFKKALKANQTSMVAFVAPWCGHCQRMAPEYSKAALGLYPLLPAYAVNCDDEKNKRLCADQGVQGFPTIKLFPRGRELAPILYDGGERTASAFFYWATRRIPKHVTKLFNVEDIQPWIEKTAKEGKPRALLLTKDKKIPLLWQVLGNKYAGQLDLASHRDRKGRSSVKLGYEAGEKNVPKVLIYPVGSNQAVRYEGINKFDSLSKFFDSVLDGTADLTIVNEEAAAEEFVVSEEELEIERKQEAQRIALAHGGFSDLIDFEEALKKGHGAGFHDSHGFAGGMGDIPKKKPAKASESATGEGESKKEEVVETGVTPEQVVFATSTIEESAPTETPVPTTLAQESEPQESTAAAAEPEPAEPPKDEL